MFYCGSHRFKKLSGALYSVTVLAVPEKLVSVSVPARTVNDISGNPNSASNQLQVKHCMYSFSFCFLSLSFS